jgi:hypothetical protein
MGEMGSSDPTEALKALQDLTVPVPIVVPPVEPPSQEDMNPGGAHIIPDDEFDDVFDHNAGRNNDIPLAQDMGLLDTRTGRNDAVEHITGRNVTVPPVTNQETTRMGTRSAPSNEVVEEMGPQRTNEVERLNTYYNPTIAVVDEDEEDLATGIGASCDAHIAIGSRRT